MATGDSMAVFMPQQNEPPSTNFAVFGVLAAATGQRPFLKFDPSTQYTAIFSSIMLRRYGGSGLSVRVVGTMDGANTGTKVVGVSVSLERVTVGDALGAAGSDFAAEQTTEITVDNTANNEFEGTITFTNGAQMDSVVAGDFFRLRIRRKVASLSGTNASGNYLLLGVEVKET